MSKTGSVPDLIAVNMPGGSDFVDTVQRLWNAGDAVLPLDTRLPDSALTAVLESMGAAAIIDNDGERHTLPHGRPVDTGDALVMTTSGSTGVPKGVIHTHASLSASAELTSRALGVTSDDHWLACLPVSHIGGFSVITKALHMKTALTVHPGFDVDAVTAAARNGANLVSLVPTALARIDPALFKTILLGGSAIPADRPSNTVATYGSTETGSGIVYDHYALEQVELRVDAEGQLLVQSPTLLRCYRDDTDPRDADGWYATGDAGSIGADGYVTVVGRIAEVINTGGEKVWPSVVENALKTHPDVCDALVFGEPDPEWGERVVARIEISEHGTLPQLEELREHVKQQLPAFAAPRLLEVVQELPRTSNGKVDRSESARR